ncbi:hypothetical protein NW765_001359 [Fusarium oxysporum]|nr:hypothetical protein NW765_001359 [Fusarium oxysporum]KAJ4280860.1 hypothetical protein NW764_005205 [Fusarium oxysporum]
MFKMCHSAPQNGIIETTSPTVVIMQNEQPRSPQQNPQLPSRSHLSLQTTHNPRSPSVKDKNKPGEQPCLVIQQKVANLSKSPSFPTSTFLTFPLVGEISYCRTTHNLGVQHTL